MAPNTKVVLDNTLPLVNQSLVKAQIIDGADGDTVKVKILEVPSTFTKYPNLKINSEEYKVRLAGIDTPEKNVGGTDSTPYEHKFAEMSSAFAASKLANGKIV
ncbi:UNVERIFIED_CONTAM: hypothetical protein O8I53_07735 [Campylobacter lari]